MLNVRTSDAATAIRQCEELYRAGAEILRLSVDTPDDVKALRKITAASPVPLVADIQFERDAAIPALEAGAAAVRVNPGLFPEGSAEFAALAAEVADRHAAIRVGANAGSIGDAAIRSECGKGLSREKALAQLLAEKTLRQCEALEKLGVHDVKAALKCSDVGVTVEANRIFAARSEIPLHLGVTEAGTPYRGIVKSACGIGALLLSGIGDTIRVSLTASPIEEVRAGIAILEVCGLRSAEPEIVSCPTCGRTAIDLPRLVRNVEEAVAKLKSAGKRLRVRKIAVMGCPVNGPGEARDADLGLAGCRNGQVVLFRRGEILGAFDAEAGLKKLEELLAAASEP
jgi:(E)-4-hydroxy-3-methylbut-2-enyl-diphosphate synthase